MKKLIVPLYFAMLLFTTFISSAYIINTTKSGTVHIMSGKEIYLTDKEIYEDYPQFMKYDYVYKKYSVIQKFSKGIIFPKIQYDTIWENSVYAENRGQQ